jgi:ketosteroid isomerase-like protein
MHANAALLNRLFDALGRHDHAAMAACYHPKARFRDIAFDLEGRKIGDMWRMVCSGDIRVEIEQVEADDRTGLARIVDRYSFGRKQKPVVNRIESRFQFRNGRIVRQDDDCDPQSWAEQSLGRGPLGALAGRSRLVRSVLARGKLAWWILRHPDRRR